MNIDSTLNCSPTKLCNAQHVRKSRDLLTLTFVMRALNNMKIKDFQLLNFYYWRIN